jgi:uncharacterized protein
LTESNEQNTPQTENPNRAPLSRVHPALFVLLVLFVIFVTYQIFGGLLSIMVLGTDLKAAPKNLSLARVVVSFAQFMFILAPVILLSMLQGNKAKTVFRLNAPKSKVFWLSMLGIVVIQPLLQAYMLIQNKLLFSLPFGTEFLTKLKEVIELFESATLNLVTAHSVVEFIVVVFIIAVTPAICEEFLFRGLIFKNFEKSIPTGKAIFMTGLIFAIFHFHPFNLIPLILLGYYLTYTVYYSNSIWTGVLVHFINNFISAYLVFRYGRESFDRPDESLGDNIEVLIAGAVSAILFMLILYAIKKSSTDKTNKIVVNV